MKHGNMRTCGTMLTEKLVDEKCTTEATPCIRYFIGKDGEKITVPEEFVAGDALVTPTEYRKRVENINKRSYG